MPDISFADWVTGLAADTLSGVEKFPLLDVSTPKHATAALLAAFTIDQLHQAGVVTTLNDADELNVFQSDVEKIITADNFFNWVVDKLEALSTSASIVSGDKLLFSDAGVLQLIDIDDVKTFLDSEATSLGAEIAALSAATLADTDQYVLAQGSTALKTTFADIAARVHAQFLTYTAGLSAVATLADADTFYVSDGGVASKVTASVVAAYVEAEVGSSILESAWDDYSALGGVAAATDVFLLERSSTGRTVTGANLASYIIGTQDSASAAVAAATGDDLLMYRAGTQYKLDIDLLSTYVLASGWSAASGSPVVTADKVIIGRGGTTYSVTVDQLQTFVLDGIQATVLDLTGLSSTTLASGSIFLVGDGSTAEKATLAELETKLWADYETYVSALTALTGLADADVFYVIDGGVPKKITAANMGVYMDDELWDVSAASPTIQAGDDLWMRRSSTSYTLDVDELAGYVATAVAGGLDISALTAATLSDADLMLVDDGGTNKKVTLANLRTHFWTELVDYVSNLTDGSPPADADLLYLISSGSPYQISLGDLWDNRYLTDAQAIKLDDFATPDDNTDLDATTSAHGLLPKLSNDTKEFMRGDGSWAPYSSVTEAAVAATGSLYTDAAALAATNTTFITCDSTAKGVKLPNGVAGDILNVINNSGTDAKLYPATGGTLNGLATNAAVVIPASKGVTCFCSSADTWTVFDMPAVATTA